MGVNNDRCKLPQKKLRYFSLIQLKNVGSCSRHKTLKGSSFKNFSILRHQLQLSRQLYDCILNTFPVQTSIISRCPKD